MTKSARSFFSNVSVLGLGTTASYFLPVAFSPILTRLYSPHDFAVFAVFFAITSITATVSTFRYELAILLPEEEEDAIHLLILAVSFCFGISLLILLLAGIENTVTLDALRKWNFSFWLPLSFGCILGQGIQQSIYCWQNRLQQYGRIAIYRFASSLVNVFLSLLFGVYGFSEMGLIYSLLASQMAVSVWMIGELFLKERERLRTVRSSKMYQLAFEYKDFFTFSTIGSLLNTLSNYAPVLLLSALYPKSVVGHYALTQRVVNLPMKMIGNSVSVVFYRQANEAKTQGGLENLVRKTTISLLAINIVPMAILFFFGPFLFSFVFGEAWRYAGIIAQIMAPFYLIRFVFSCQSNMMMVFRKLDYEIKFNLAYLLIQAASVLFVYLSDIDVSTIFILMSLLSSFLFLHLGYFIFSTAKRGSRPVR